MKEPTTHGYFPRQDTPFKARGHCVDLVVCTCNMVCTHLHLRLQVCQKTLIMYIPDSNVDRQLLAQM